MKKTAVILAVIFCMILFSSCIVLEFPLNPAGEAESISSKQSTAASVPYTVDMQEKNTIKSRHYYNILNAEEQEAYHNMLTAVQKHEKQAFLPMLAETQISKVFQALCYDNPLLFCLENQFGWGKSGNRTFIEFHYTDTAQECSEKAEKMERILDEAMRQIHNGMDDFQKELALHDWLAKRCEYSESGSVSYTAYGALVNGKAVCEGYSKAMLLLLNRAGISGFLMTGQAVTNGVAGGHMWNIVAINGENYHLDVTWNVPKGAERIIQHAYFNLTDEQIAEDHSDFDTKQSDCTSLKENYYSRMGTLFDSYDELLEKLPNAVSDILSAGGNIFEFRLNSRESYDEAVTKLFEYGTIYDVLENVSGGLNISSISHMSTQTQCAVLCKLG